MRVGALKRKIRRCRKPCGGETVVFGDFEWGFAKALSGVLGVPAYAGVLPSDAEEECLQVITTGGTVENPGIARPMVMVHVRSGSEAGVVDLANRLVGAVHRIDVEQSCSTDCVIVGAGVVGLPYLSPDPSHPDWQRASLGVRLTVKAIRETV